MIAQWRYHLRSSVVRRPRRVESAPMTVHRTENPLPALDRQLSPSGSALSLDETQDEAETSPGEIVARPDGYHWIAPDGRQEFGPFETLELAQAARDGGDDTTPAPGETLQEAEAEIGVADWIDPETGAPAEGACPPHLTED